MLATVLEMYGIDANSWNIHPFGNGLINHTWLIKKDDEEYILQRVNHNVFKNPYIISDNIRSVGDFLQQHFPQYYFVRPLNTYNGRDLVETADGFFRLIPFVKDSLTYTTVESPELAYEAARQFGTFTHHLAAFDVSRLKETIPDFHNLTLRSDQFHEALKVGDKKRLQESAGIIDDLQRYQPIVAEFERIKRNPQFKKRVMHHDTKISNVLFDQHNNGLCVIDLDTVMPGFFISDVGDMMRTYLAAVSEEETDFTTIDVREDYFVAIVQGYLSVMNGALTEEEQKGFIYAGKFMIYMQCIRFLADHLLNDVYYGAKYEGQNYNRAVNQLFLLKSLEQKEDSLLQKIKQQKSIYIV